MTKLHIPPLRPDLVPRPRLLERLDDGVRLGRPLSLLSAPAGSGKTTLLSEWIMALRSPTPGSGAVASDGLSLMQRQRNVTGCGVPLRSRVAWLSLDEQDDEPGRFWTYLIAALQTIEAGLGQASLAMLQSPQQAPVEGILTPLLNEIAVLPDSAAPPGILLVLDDYHLVSHPAIHEGMAFLLDHPIPSFHLAISTRADPPLPIFRLRARSQLTEVRSDDLRFSAIETTVFLNRVMGLDLTTKSIEALEARTEGWIVGLQLAALSLGGRTDRDLFISTFAGSHHYVLEYLTDEVVSRQPAQVRKFLLQTSILERLSGPLCDALMTDGGRTTRGENRKVELGELSPLPIPSPSGQEMLLTLKRQNLFVVPLDDEHCWYRYHHLFAGLLANLLRKERSEECIRELHRRASLWYEQHGFLASAIGHALQAEDYEQASRLIGEAAQAVLSQGRLATLLQWLEALPNSMLCYQPHLRLYQAWALHLSGHSGDAERMLREAREMTMAEPPSPENEVLRGRMAALLVGIASLRGSTSETIEQAQEALSYLPPDDLDSRARVLVALGTACAYEDRSLEAEQAWRQAVQLALESGNPFLAAAAIELLAGMQIYHQGRLREGALALQRVLDLGTAADGSLLPFTTTTHALLADVFLEWNDQEGAASYLDRGIELMQRGGIAYGLPHTYCAKARLARAREDRQGARKALQAAKEAVSALPMWHIIVHQAACQTRLHLWMGDVDEAGHWARFCKESSECALPATLPLYLGEVQSLSLARVCLARGQVDEARETLAEVISGASSAGRTAHLIEAHLLNALALQASGDPEAAMAALERSLLLAEPEGYMRLFLEVGESLAPQLSRLRAWVQAQPAQRPLPEQDRLLRYADKLLAAFPHLEPPVTLPPTAGLSSSIQGLVEPLTTRELEVLQLICAGMSNRQVADRLTITLNTVKKHASNIYGKLEVQSRAQAIVRARDLGLC